MIFKKEVEFEIDEVTCKPGQTFTVWLSDRKKNVAQVELRVTPTLELEIYFDSEDIKIKSFDDWKALKRNK